MRRALIALIVGALVVGVIASPSVAGKKKKKVERSVEASYIGPAAYAQGVGTFCSAEPYGCASFDVEPGERYVRLEIADSLGQPVYASVYVFGYTDGSDSHDHICGSTESPLALASGVKKLVVVVGESGGITGGCPGPATNGTVTATFSNLP